MQLWIFFVDDRIAALLDAKLLAKQFDYQLQDPVDGPVMGKITPFLPIMAYHGTYITHSTVDS